MILQRVSGADLRKEAESWRRRKFKDAPCIPAQVFVQCFVRRVEAACRTDLTALPILYSVSHKYSAEHIMNTLANLYRNKGWTTDAHTVGFVTAAHSLYHHLKDSTIDQGVHRAPIAGDTSVATSERPHNLKRNTTLGLSTFWCSTCRDRSI